MRDRFSAMHAITRVCCKCEQEKKLDAFFRDRHSASGISSYCKACSGGANPELGGDSGYARGDAIKRLKEIKRVQHRQDGRMFSVNGL